MVSEDDTQQREMAYVRLLNGSGKGGVYVLRDFSVFAVGTAEECQIRLDDPTVDARHAFITRQDEQWTFRDPQERETCHVNDIPTNFRPLEGGEIIRIGKAELYFTFRKPQTRQVPADADSGDVAAGPSEPPKLSGGTVVVSKKEKVEEETGSFSALELQEGLREARASSVRLVVVDGDPRDIGREVVLPLDGEVLLGRSPECEFPLHDRKMSRCHSRIQRDGDRYRISDLSSMNGTVVNGLRTASARFGVGDYIRLGFTVIAVQRVREEATST